MQHATGPIRVLVGVHGGGLTGIDTYAEQLASAAAEAAAEVVLLATTSQGAAALRGRVGARVEVVDLGLEPTTPRQALLFRVSPAAASRRLERALAPYIAASAGRFEMVHLNHPPLAAVARGPGRRIVVAGWFHPHSPVGRMAETWRHTGRRLPRSGAMALKALAHYRNDVRGYRAADCITTPTEQLAADLRRQGLPARRLIPPAAAPVASPEARDDGGPRAGNEVRLAVCAGDLGLPRKNVAAAIGVVGELAARGRPARLTLIGGNAGALRREIARLPAGATAEAAGRLPPEAVAARLRAADALLLPSLFEEWGYVGVEAALQGTPVVAFPVYPFAEMLEPPMGRTAAAVGAVALADAVEATLSSVASRTAIADAARARFGTGAIAARLQELWSAIR